MIVDLNLCGKTVLVVGGGGEAQKRINSLMDSGCLIIVVGTPADHLIREEIIRLADQGAIKLMRKTIQDTKLVTEIMPDIIIAATSNRRLNHMLIKAARRERILAYSSDNPEESDFANLAVVDIADDLVRIAISTGGRSPAMSRELKARISDALLGLITSDDIARIKTHGAVRRIVQQRRNAANNSVHPHNGNDECCNSTTPSDTITVTTSPASGDGPQEMRLHTILDDRQITDLVRNGMMDDAEALIAKKLESFGK